MKKASIIGGGLAGSEAAYYLLKKGYEVTLFEARPFYKDEAHHSSNLGELVCSNSLKSKRLDNACGLLKEEIKHMGSIIMEASSSCEVPSGNALSVDRDKFSSYISNRLSSFKSFHLERKEITALPNENVILSTGPLTSPCLLEDLKKVVGKDNLSFFDASAPIVKKQSIDFNKAYFKSRYEQDDSSYINCPFTKNEYYVFVKELLNGKKAILHSFDTKYFEGCLPIEVIASRGMETLRHGPLKPFGLEKEGERPYAVVQLRQDDYLGDYYNLVGFQTNLTYPEQKRVFSLIPGLENAEFIKYGLMHRNSYIDSPDCLNLDLSLKNKNNVFVGGQLCGVEGYVESAASGLIAAISFDKRIKGDDFVLPPKNTIIGALLNYVLFSSSSYFSPMNANWALLPFVNKHNKEEAIATSLNEIEKYYEKMLH